MPGVFFLDKRKELPMDIPVTPTVRISLPSKGRLAEESLAFLEACGLTIYKPNPRQYQATIKGLPEVTVLFQRPGDIVTSVRDGSVDFGLSGLDVIEERKGDNGDVLILHESLGFGACALALAVPEGWSEVTDVASLRQFAANLPHPLRIATKYPQLTSRFFDPLEIAYSLIYAEGTLETAPAIGYADMISDLVSSGQTLRDNRLRQLTDGVIVTSQAALIANIHSLRRNPQALSIARYLLETFDAHLRAEGNLAIFANMRGSSPESIAERIFNQTSIGGLQGPTISRVVVREQDQSWYAVNVIVHRFDLFKAINELRAIGGSGVVVIPVSYIFEEEPPRYKAMLAAVYGGSNQ
jgi:ATP phosphoribosyltransferase